MSGAATAYPSLAGRPDTLPAQLAWRAQTTPDLPAITALDGRLTFAEWAARSAAACELLAQRGVEPGSLVGIWGENADGCAWVVALLAIHGMGAMAVPLNSRMGLEGSLRQLTELGGTHIVLSRERAGDVPPGVTPIFFDELRAESAPDLLRTDCSENDPAGIFHTSGTTGKPKAVVLSQATTTFIAAATEDHILGAPAGIEPLREGDVLQTSVALHTTSGLMHMIAVSLFSGVHLVCEAKFDIDATVETMKREGTTVWFGVPAMMILLGDRYRNAVPGTKLRVVWHSGAVVTDGALKSMRVAFPDAAAINIYSLTESGAGIVSSTAGDALDAPGTVGRPLPTTQIRIVALDGSPCRHDEVGEVLLKSPYMLDGFYRDGAVVPPELEDGWLRSGDGGSIDAAGRLWLAGRLTDVIIRGGYNVHPAAVEGTILELDDVIDVAVVPIPHRVLGEDIAAVVVAHAPIEVEALREHCRRWLANYEIPREVFFVDELPRNEFGKLKRREVVELVRGLTDTAQAPR